MTRPTLRVIFKLLDSGVYRGHSQRTGGLAPNKRLNNPSNKCKDKKLTAVLALLITLQMVTALPSHGATYSVDQLRLYTHSRVISFKEFMCIDKIFMLESRYNYQARNGSHYGIGQMRSKHYQSRDPYTQIDLSIAYSYKRYMSLCNAYAFHKTHGYY
jgi:hypothetical protein